MIYAFVGKTCSGKSTAFHHLLNLGYATTESYTTRPKRPDETDGEEYQFITKEEFNELQHMSLIVAPRVYNDWYYGMNLLSINPNMNQIVIVDPKGYRDLKNDIGEENVVGIYFDAPKDVRFYRGANRKDSLEELNRRMAADEEDFKGIELEVDYVISSLYKEDVIKSVRAIIEGDAS